MRRMIAVLLALAAGLIVLTALTDDASAQKRVAFVVGTDKYDNLDKTRQLQRAVNDARAVGAAFKTLGFEVVAAENLTRGQFNDQFQKFLDKLKTGDTTAIYYAGHGVEIEGLNFLLPRDIPDIKYGRQEQIKRESLSVAELLLDLRGRNPEIALVILDACRDNPLIPDEMRSAGTRGGGLAPLKGEPPKGTFIMYSAGAGESALDRLPGKDPDQVNSIFTRKLLPLIGTKGLALHDLARQLRADVLQLASTVPHTQRPAYYDGVIGRYCLAGCDGAEQVPKRVEPSTIEDRVSEAARTWETLRNSASLADLEAFATRYKDTYFAGLAKARIDDIKRTQVTSKSYTYKSGDYQKRAEAETAQQATKKKAEDDARAKEEAERKRLAMLQQNDERKRTEVEAAKKRAETAGAMQAGSVFRDCPECPEMVVVPAGEFDLRAPVQSKVVTIKPFAVGKFEVTFAEWAACVAGGGCEANTNPDDKGWGRGKRPVINVSWDDATQYTAWLSKATGKSYRLLREAEWAYAALGVTKSPAPQTRFATGATISTANFSSDKTVEVGSFPGNAFGLHDLHGNVWEWVQDCYYPWVRGPEDGSAITPTNCPHRTLRGGSWNDYPSSDRITASPFGRNGNIGFRVARTL